MNCATCGKYHPVDSVLICPDCGKDMCPDCIDTRHAHDDLDVFDDRSTRGLGHDGNTHSDPYCAAIAPFNSYEARHGELCELCEERRKPAD